MVVAFCCGAVVTNTMLGELVVGPPVFGDAAEGRGVGLLFPPEATVKKNTKKISNAIYLRLFTRTHHDLVYAKKKTSETNSTFMLSVRYKVMILFDKAFTVLRGQDLFS